MEQKTHSLLKTDEEGVVASIEGTRPAQVHLKATNTDYGDHELAQWQVEHLCRPHELVSHERVFKSR